MSGCCCGDYEPPAWGQAGLTVARVVMGALFIFSGCAKLGFLSVFDRVFPPIAHAGIDPAAFAGTIKAFAVVHPDLVPFFTYALPWTELVCGTALVLGIFPRGAAWIIVFLLISFIAAMISVMLRGMDIDCSCFGKFLGGKVGWLSLLRNAIFLVIMTPVVKYGGGYLALGSWLSPRKMETNGQAGS